jgi:hypothetical protein
MSRDDSRIETMETEVIPSAKIPLLSEEEAYAMSDEDVAELLRNRLER